MLGGAIGLSALLSAVQEVGAAVAQVYSGGSRRPSVMALHMVGPWPNSFAVCCALKLRRATERPVDSKSVSDFKAVALMTGRTPTTRTRLL